MTVVSQRGRYAAVARTNQPTTSILCPEAVSFFILILTHSLTLFSSLFMLLLLSPPCLLSLAVVFFFFSFSLCLLPKFLFFFFHLFLAFCFCLVLFPTLPFFSSSLFFFFVTTAMLRCGSQFSSRCFVFGFCYRVNFERCFNRGI